MQKSYATAIVSENPFITVFGKIVGRKQVLEKK
jgi:hypothetical protein